MNHDLNLGLIVGLIIGLIVGFGLVSGDPIKIFLIFLHNVRIVGPIRHRDSMLRQRLGLLSGLGFVPFAFFAVDG